MFAGLKSRLAPPKMPTVEETRTARRIYAVLILGFVMASLLALLSVAGAGGITEMAVYASFVGLIIVVAMLVLLRGAPRQALLVALIPANLTVALSMWANAGVENPAFSIVLMLLTVVSVLLGSRALNLFAGVWGIYLFFLYWAERAGQLGGSPQPDLSADALLLPLIGLILTTSFLNLVLERVLESHTVLTEQAHFLEARTTALGEANAQLQREVAERQHIEQDLRRREVTLRTLSIAGRRLLEGQDFERTLQELLAALGGSLDASRGAVFCVNELGDGDVEGVQIVAWASSVVDPQLHDVPSVAQFRFRHAGMGKWQAAYQKKQVINVALPEMTAEERRLLDPLNMRAFLSVPIHVGDHWWGMINFGDCLQAREWTTFEVETTRILASLIGAALARQEMERALRHHQKLEGVGLLAGGVAHDFNNLLTGIIAQNDLALQRLARGGDPVPHIRKAMVSGQRAADLTRQLLAYAGKSRFQNEPVDLNLLIEENSALLDTLTRENIELQLALASELPLITADRGQLQQILMNLVINAVEALEGRTGRVTVTTVERSFEKNQTVESSFVVRPPAPGRFVCLEVRDGGRGMDRHTLDRIFDPFFSTKDSGRGLGLSTMLGIVRTLNGALQVQSAPEWGTLFRVFLPAGDAPSQSQAPDPTDADLADAADRVILIIDDEPAVREAAQDILELSGYEVIVAGDGQEGLDLFRRRRERIGLVLVDMKMPGMNGLEVMASIWGLAPEALIILSTGYSEHVLDEAALPRQPAVFLHKPYDGYTLLSAVQRAFRVGSDPIAAKRVEK